MPGDVSQKTETVYEQISNPALEDFDQTINRKQDLEVSEELELAFEETAAGPPVNNAQPPLAFSSNKRFNLRTSPPKKPLKRAPVRRQSDN